MADLHLAHHTDEFGYNIFKKTPIVTFSAARSPDMRLEFSNYFFQLDHWTKPLSLRSLTARLGRLAKGPVASTPVDTRDLLKSIA